MRRPHSKILDFNVAPTSFRDALAEFDLNWQVGLRPIFTANAAGELCQIPGYRSVNRLDKDIPLSVVGGRYVPVQHDQLGDIVDGVVSGLGARYVNGGLFGDGERVFLQAEFPDTIRVKGSTDDLVKKYLTFLSSHDSSLPAVLGGTNTRIVCQNTFMMAFKDARRDVRIRHTNNAQLRLEESKDVLKAMLEYHNAVELKVSQLANSKFSDAMMAEALRKVFDVDMKTPLSDVPKKTINNMETVAEYFESGLGIDSTNRGTGWAAYNAFTQYSNHDKVVKKEDENPMNRTESLLIGSGANFNLNALQVIESIAQLA